MDSCALGSTLELSSFLAKLVTISTNLNYVYRNGYAFFSA